MNPVTYTLSPGSKNSDLYYSEINAFADLIVEKSEKHLSTLVDDYIRFLKRFNLESPREKEEYLLELLSFGVLWKTYAATALSVIWAPYVLLSRMSEWRKKHQRIKPAVDLARGLLIGILLFPIIRRKRRDEKISIELIDRVCAWLEATGEFREPALRFIRWRAYWGTLSKEKQSEIFFSISKFVEWFDKQAGITLGKYTSNVENFISRSGKKYFLREDRISCLRKPVEYHLNMIGACLMNRAFRKEFTSTENTTLLLPGCMRARPQETCKAIKEPKGLKCAGCEKKCRVNQLRLIGLNKNFEVYVIPHASDLSLWSPKEGERRRGVVASACVTTLVEGGWELKRYGIPAQCVLLEYSGCKKHWHPVGVQTEINLHELDRIINKN